MAINYSHSSSSFDCIIWKSLYMYCLSYFATVILAESKNQPVSLHHLTKNANSIVMLWNEKRTFFCSNKKYFFCVLLLFSSRKCLNEWNGMEWYYFQSITYSFSFSSWCVIAWYRTKIYAVTQFMLNFFWRDTYYQSNVLLHIVSTESSSRQSPVFSIYNDVAMSLFCTDLWKNVIRNKNDMLFRTNFMVPNGFW